MSWHLVAEFVEIESGKRAKPLKKEDGTSAQWTWLDASNPAFAKLNNREAYYGEVTIFGKTYDAGYEPIIHVPTRQVVGAFFVGYQK